MYKETITYVDYNGMERTEPFYFNLTEAEVMEMEMSVKGGLAEMIQRIVDAKDQPAIIKIFKELITKSYGVKTPDGRGFRKSESLTEDFIATPAFSKMFMKLATDADAAAAFVNGIVPENLSKQAAATHPALAAN